MQRDDPEYVCESDCKRYSSVSEDEGKILGQLLRLDERKSAIILEILVAKGTYALAVLAAQRRSDDGGLALLQSC